MLKKIMTGSRWFPSLLLVGLVLSACSESALDADLPDASPQAGSNLAPLSTYDPETSTYQSLEGTGLEIESFRGRKVFVNYWATWCAPCIRELPSIAQAEAELADENFIFLLASDESPEKISEFIEERGFAGNFIKLNGYFGAHNIHAVPSSVLYDEEGTAVRQWDGAYEWDSDEMLGQIRNPLVTE